MPDTNTNSRPAWVTALVRSASSGTPLVVRSPAKKSGTPAAARSSAGRASRLLCRSDATARRGRGSVGGRPRGNRDQPREAEKLVVEVLADRLRPSRSPAGPRAAPPVSAIRSRSSPGSRSARAAAGGAPRRPRSRAHRPRRRPAACVGAPRSGRARRAPPAIPIPSAAPNVIGISVRMKDSTAVASLRSQPLHVHATAGHVPDRAALDRTGLDPEPCRQPDRVESRPPVHQRHVDVQSAAVAGMRGQPDRAGRQFLVGPIDRHGSHRSGHRPQQDQEHRPEAHDLQRSARDCSHHGCLPNAVIATSRFRPPERNSGDLREANVRSSGQARRDV